MRILRASSTVFKDGMKLRLQAMGRDVFYYPTSWSRVTRPTATVTPGKPQLLIEVLSENENKDLIEKFFAYQRLASLEEYVVVSPDPIRFEVRIFRRTEGWEPGETHHDGEFTLRSIGLTLRVRDLYAS